MARVASTKGTGGGASASRAAADRSGAERAATAKASRAASTKAGRVAPGATGAATKRAPATSAPQKPAKPATAKAATRAATKTGAGAKATSGTKAATARATATKKPATKRTPRTSRKKTVICPLSGFEVTPSAPGLAPRTKERLKQKLLDEKARLLRQVEELVAEAEELAREREAGDTQFDEESGEGDTVAVERERDLLLSAQARQVIEEIDAALERMRRGTYGVCSYAGRKIPVERLEAIPWADVCVDCKARAERRR